MSRLAAVITACLAALVAACGAGQAVKHRGLRSPTAAGRASIPARAPSVRMPQALVTAETQNRLLVVDLPDGHIIRRVPLAPDPEDIAVTGDGGTVLVASARSGKVTVIRRRAVRPIKALGGFDDPHIVEISPDRRYAYVTDDVPGTLTVIRLSDAKVTSTIVVGAGAHHLTFAPDQRRAWIALGESASRITIVDTTDPAHPRVVAHFDPGFPAHDLFFSPDGRKVWISSATGPDVTVFDARRRGALFRVSVGTPPQHLAFDGRYAYATSGYGGTIEQVNAATGRVEARASAPHGSFELDAADGFVATASLLDGRLAVYTPELKLLRVVKLAPATREVAISRP